MCMLLCESECTIVKLVALFVKVHTLSVKAYPLVVIVHTLFVIVDTVFVIVQTLLLKCTQFYNSTITFCIKCMFLKLTVLH